MRQPRVSMPGANDESATFIAHLVRATGASVADIGVTSGADVGRDFTVAGSYAYHCSIHSNMTGHVIVQ